METETEMGRREIESLEGDTVDAGNTAEGGVETERYSGSFQFTASSFPRIPPLAEPRQSLGNTVRRPGPGGQSRPGRQGRSEVPESQRGHGSSEACTASLDGPKAAHAQSNDWRVVLQGTTASTQCS